MAQGPPHFPPSLWRSLKMPIVVKFKPGDKVAYAKDPPLWGAGIIQEILPDKEMVLVIFTDGKDFVTELFALGELRPWIGVVS